MTRKTRKMFEDTKIIKGFLPGVIIDGIPYDTPAEAADDWNVSTMAISTWINGQVVHGIYYPPFSQCRPQFANDAHRRAWQRRIKSQKAKHRSPPGFPPAVVINGFIYPSVRHAAVEFNVTPNTICGWCRANTKSNCWYVNKNEYDKAA